MYYFINLMQPKKKKETDGIPKEMTNDTRTIILGHTKTSQQLAQIQNPLERQMKSSFHFCLALVIGDTYIK